MNSAAIILAAGKGTRAGTGPPKQWRYLCGKRIIEHTINKFAEHPSIKKLVIVVNSEDINLLDNKSFLVVKGGKTRSESVFNGLKALANSNPKLVLIHDVARATVPRFVIDNVLNALLKHKGAAPGLPVTDALWHSKDKIVLSPQSRLGLYRAQTPQGFHYKEIMQAYFLNNEITDDDVGVAIKAGINVTIVPGCENNIKITYPQDFDRAEKILRNQI